MAMTVSRTDIAPSLDKGTVSSQLVTSNNTFRGRVRDMAMTVSRNDSAPSLDKGTVVVSS